MIRVQHWTFEIHFWTHLEWFHGSLVLWHFEFEPESSKFLKKRFRLSFWQLSPPVNVYYSICVCSTVPFPMYFRYFPKAPSRLEPEQTTLLRNWIFLFEQLLDERSEFQIDTLVQGCKLSISILFNGGTLSKIHHSDQFPRSSIFLQKRFKWFFK